MNDWYKSESPETTGCPKTISIVKKNVEITTEQARANCKKSIEFGNMINEFFENRRQERWLKLGLINPNGVR